MFHSVAAKRREWKAVARRPAQQVGRVPFGASHARARRVTGRERPSASVRLFNVRSRRLTEW